MKRFFFIFLLLISHISAAYHPPRYKPYFSLRTGATYLHYDNINAQSTTVSLLETSGVDTQGLIGIAFGAPLPNRPLSMELEYYRRKTSRIDLDIVRLTTSPVIAREGTNETSLFNETYMVNLFYDFFKAKTMPVTGSFMLGLGVSTTDTVITQYINPTTTEVYFKNKDSGFGYQFGPKMTWMLLDTLGIELAYRYANLGRSRSRSMAYKKVSGTLSTVVPADFYNASVTAHDLVFGLRLGL